MEALPQQRQENDPEPLRDVLTLLSQDDSSLLKQLASYIGPQIVSDLGTRLRNRDLPKRACVFARTLVDMVMNPKDVFDAMPQDKSDALIRETLGKSLQKLLSSTKPLSSSGLSGERLARLERDIADEAAIIAALVKKSRPTLVPEDQVGPSLVTVLAMTELPGLNKDCLVLENTRLMHSSSRSITDEQSDAADIYKSLGYVMTDANWREIVCLATRKVVEEMTREGTRPTLVEFGQGDDFKVQAKAQGRTIINYEGVIRRAGLS